MVLAVAAVVRSALAGVAALRSGAAAFMAPDTLSYIKPARGLIETGEFATGGTVEFVRTPGYPLLLLPGAWFDQVAAVTVPLQILLGVVTVYLVYRVAETLTGNERIAFFASLGYACEPLAIIYTARLLSETLFAAILMCSLLVLLRYDRRPSWHAAAVAGGLIAAAAFVRPVAYYLPLIITTWAVIAAFLDKSERRRRLVHAAVMFVAAAVPLFAWHVRNDVRAGYPRFSAIVEKNLYFYHAAAVEAAVTEAPYLEVRKQFGFGGTADYAAAHPAQADWSPAEQYDWMRHEALSILREHPGPFARWYVIGIARTLVDPGVSDLRDVLAPDAAGTSLLASTIDRGWWATVRDVAQRHTLFFVGAMLMALVFAATGVAALVGLPTVARTPGGWLLIFVAGYFVLISGGATAVARFRHPLMPVLWVVAAVGIERMLAFANRDRAPAAQQAS